MKDLIKINQVNLDKIIHLLHSPEELVEADPSIKEKLEILAFADTQLRRYPKMREVANLLMQQHKMCKTTAYKTIREAQYVYGSVSVYEKKYWRSILIEKALQVLEHCQQKNKVKEFNMTMASLIKLYGFGEKEEGKLDADLLKQHQVFVMVNFKDQKDSYTIDVSKLHQLPIEERMRLIREVEVENIEFDMMRKIQIEEQNEDA